MIVVPGQRDFTIAQGHFAMTSFHITTPEHGFGLFIQTTKPKRVALVNEFFSSLLTENNFIVFRHDLKKKINVEWLLLLLFLFFFYWRAENGKEKEGQDSKVQIVVPQFLNIPNKALS